MIPARTVGPFSRFFGHTQPRFEEFHVTRLLLHNRMMHCLTRCRVSTALVPFRLLRPLLPFEIFPVGVLGGRDVAAGAEEVPAGTPSLLQQTLPSLSTRSCELQAACDDGTGVVSAEDAARGVDSPSPPRLKFPTKVYAQKEARC